MMERGEMAVDNFDIQDNQKVQSVTCLLHFVPEHPSSECAFV